MEKSPDCSECPPVQIIDVANVKIHEDFNEGANRAGFDIALVRLKDLALLFFVRLSIDHLYFIYRQSPIFSYVTKTSF